MKTFPVKLTTSKLTALAILLALNIVFGYFTINIFAFSFGLSLLTVVLMSKIAGLFWCGMLLALADLLQDIMHGWALNPLFSIGAAVTGLLCGFFYFQRQLSIKKRQDWLKVFAVTLANTVLVNIIIDSFALSLQTTPR